MIPEMPPQRNVKPGSATPTRGQRQSLTPPSTAKPQIIQCDITVSVAPAVLKTTVAALAQPPFPFKSENQIKHRR